MDGKMHITLASIAAVLMLASLVGQAAATTGVRISGYQWVSDVTGYFNMTQDFCDIQAALGVNNSLALDIFNNGKNSNRGAAKRSFNLWSTTNSSGELSYEAIYAGRDAAFFSTLFEAAVNADDYDAALMLVDAIKIKYLLHEVDAFVSNTARNRSSDSSGAPHNLDEAAGIWTGSMTGGCHETMEHASQHTAYFLGTQAYRRMGLVSLAMSRAFNNGQYAARNNMTAGAESARLDIHRQVITYLLQYMTERAAVGEVCGHNATAAQRSAVEAAVEILLPLLRIQGVPEEYLETIDSLVDEAPNSTYRALLTGVITSIANYLNFSPFTIGTPIPSRIASEYCENVVVKC